MDFNFTEEQSMLRDTLASFLQDKYSFDTRRASVKSASGWRADYWKAFAEELGILGAEQFDRVFRACDSVTKQRRLFQEANHVLAVTSP